MARYVEIRKHSEKSLKHYYHVKTEDGGKYDFFICIDTKNKNLLFFKGTDFSKQFAKISLEKSESLKIEGIPESLVGVIFVKAYRAIKENNFPSRLDYCV